MFIDCPRLTSLYRKIEDTFKKMDLNLKITYKLLIFGYKPTYVAYKAINSLISHIFFAVYKNWILNENSINLKNWLFFELKRWKSIYEDTNNCFEILSTFIEKWSTNRAN